MANPVEPRVSVERINELGRLAVIVGVSAGDSILQRCPEWFKLEKANALPAGSAAVLSTFHSFSLKDKARFLDTNPECVQYIFAALSVGNLDMHAVQYALTVMYRMIRDDTSKYDLFVHVLRGTDLITPFVGILDRKSDTYTSDTAAFLCAGFTTRARSGAIPPATIRKFAITLISDTWKMSPTGQLDSLSNLLKISTTREQLVHESKVTEFIRKYLEPNGAVPELYGAAFCMWLLTFNESNIKELLDNDLLKAVCRILRSSRTEKVVRLTTRTLVNAMKTENAIELIIEENCVQTLTLLEYENWRDRETYEEIQNGLASLQAKISQYSNFDRYKRELKKGKFSWGHLHTEKFWHENVKHFEHNEFEAVKGLAAILRDHKTDPVTLAVACHDVGEFARLHPTGKKILAKLQVKAVAMLLMSHSNRDVCREALLCTQKLMLDRWRDAAA